MPHHVRLAGPPIDSFPGYERVQCMSMYDGEAVLHRVVNAFTFPSASAGAVLHR